MSRGRNPSTVGRRKSKQPVELIGVLSTIATVLEAPRDRLGRLDICCGTPEGDARENLRNLALAFDAHKFQPGDHGDILEMCARVAKAAIARSSR
jgi:hypothetical protein